MTQHTPGPWEKNRHGELLGSNGKHVCLWSSGIGNAPRSPRTEANTTLVTAAPDLLEAAKLALKIAESHIHNELDGTIYCESALAELEPVRQAIAKALGQS